MKVGWKEEDIEKELKGAFELPVPKPKLKWLVPTIIIIVVIGVVGWVVIFKFNTIKNWFVSTEQPIEEYQDCGTTKPIEMQVGKGPFEIYEKDATLVCLGSNFFNDCKKSKMYSDSDSGKFWFFVDGKQGDDCLVRMVDVSTNLFLQCPYNIDELIKNNPDIKYDLSKFPGNVAFGLMWGVLFDAASPGTKCTGSMISSNQEELRVSQLTSRNMTRVFDLKEVLQALKSYYKDNNSYPIIAGCTSDNYLAIANLIGKYMSNVPFDPINSGINVYMYTGNGSNFILKANLENVDNPSLSASFFEDDLDGQVMGCDCDDPAYCIQP